MTEQELNKACDWIANMPIYYAEMIDRGHNEWIADDFRKAMSNSLEFGGIRGNKEEITLKLFYKACEAYCTNCKQFTKDCYEYCQGMQGRSCQAFESFKASLEQFRKAMMKEERK